MSASDIANHCGRPLLVTGGSTRVTADTDPTPLRETIELVHPDPSAAPATGPLRIQTIRVNPDADGPAFLPGRVVTVRPRLRPTKDESSRKVDFALLTMRLEGIPDAAILRDDLARRAGVAGGSLDGVAAWEVIKAAKKAAHKARTTASATLAIVKDDRAVDPGLNAEQLDSIFATLADVLDPDAQAEIAARLTSISRRRGQFR